MEPKAKRPGLGTGIYTYADAAKYLCVSKNRVRRWAEGYTYKLNGLLREKQPILQRDIKEPGLLTFHDLIELFFVKELLRLGIRLDDIRKASLNLSERWQTPYPFACKKVKTDGRQILLELNGSEDYENVSARQAVFGFVKDFLKDVDFAEDDLAAKWWPLGRELPVMIDPGRSFGTPVIRNRWVRTDIIYATYKAEQDVNAVAQWYKITTADVEAAILFEERCRKAA